MIRILIIAGLIYFCYRFLYRNYRSWSGNLAERRDSEVKAVEDVMVQDPFCDAYFPRREGVPLVYDGEDLLFCSKKCRDDFLEYKGNGSA